MAPKGSKAAKKKSKKGISKPIARKAPTAAAKLRRPRRRTRQSSKTTLNGNFTSASGRAAGGRKTKRATIVSFLKQHDGASVNDLIDVTGWLPHSVRAELTGLRKRGHEIVRAKDDAGITRYRIVANR